MICNLCVVNIIWFLFLRFFINTQSFKKFSKTNCSVIININDRKYSLNIKFSDWYFQFFKSFHKLWICDFTILISIKNRKCTLNGHILCFDCFLDITKSLILNFLSKLGSGLYSSDELINLEIFTFAVFTKTCNSL